MSITISEVGGGRLHSRLKSVVVSVFSAIYCRPGLIHKYKIQCKATMFNFSVSDQKNPKSYERRR